MSVFYWEMSVFTEGIPPVPASAPAAAISHSPYKTYGDYCTSADISPPYKTYGDYCMSFDIPPPGTKPAYFFYRMGSSRTARKVTDISQLETDISQY